ncbi:MAG: hypothetical protein LIO76_03370 [Clostridiales bacterium]|nr:hypothetical protein [Clostridiales bacterium]
MHGAGEDAFLKSTAEGTVLSAQADMEISDLEIEFFAEQGEGCAVTWQNDGSFSNLSGTINKPDGIFVSSDSGSTIFENCSLSLTVDSQVCAISSDGTDCRIRIADSQIGIVNTQGAESYGVAAIDAVLEISGSRLTLDNGCSGGEGGLLCLHVGEMLISDSEFTAVCGLFTDKTETQSGRLTITDSTVSVSGGSNPEGGMEVTGSEVVTGNLCLNEEASYFTDSVLEIGSETLEDNAIWADCDLYFTDCDITIRSAADGLVVFGNHSCSIGNCDLTIESGRYGISTGLKTVSITGGTSSISGVYGIYANVWESALTVIGGDHVIKGTQAAVVCESRAEDAESVISLGSSISLDGADGIDSMAEGSSILYTFGENVQYTEREEEDYPNDYPWDFEGAATEVHLYGNGEFDGILTLAQSELTQGMSADVSAVYTCGGSNPVLTFRIPENLELTEGSVTVDGAAVEYDYTDGMLCVTPSLPEGTVRFRCTVLMAGDYEIEGSAAWQTKDSADEQTGAFETLSFTADSFSLGLPNRTSRTQLTVSGKSIPGSKLTIYDNQSEAGSAEVSQAGNFTVDIQLSGTGSTHQLYAVIVTADGETVTTEPEELIYSIDCAEVSSITMTNLIHGDTQGDILEQVTVFDYLEGSASTEYYAFWPDYPDITFEVEFINCSDPLGMGQVTLISTDHYGDETEILLSYDVESDSWIGTGTFTEYTIPEKLRVAYTGDNMGTITFGFSDQDEETADSDEDADDSGSEAAETEENEDSTFSVSYRVETDGTIVLGEGEDAIYVNVSDTKMSVMDSEGNGYLLTEQDDSTILLSDQDEEELASLVLSEDGEQLTIVTPDGESLSIAMQDDAYLLTDTDGETYTMTATDDGITLTDEEGGVISLTQSEDGILRCENMDSGEAVELDTENSVLAVEDGAGNRTEYSYDEEGALSQILYPDGTTESYTYDEDGNVISYEGRDGGILSYEYDEEGYLIKALSGEENTVAASYDWTENSVTVTEENGEVTELLVNEEENREEILYPGDLAVQFVFDENGNLLSVTDPVGNVTEYTYDEDGNLLTASNGSASVEYVYDADGNLIEEKNGNGTGTAYEYDENGLLSAMENTNSDGSLLSSNAVTLDENENIIEETTEEGTWQYEVDENGQLLSATSPDGTVTSFTYSASGTQASVTEDGETVETLSNELNQIVQKGDTVYTYDANGNLLLEESPDGTVTYTWDEYGYLVQVEDADGTVYHYGYDIFGNRDEVEVNGETVRYIWVPTELPFIIGAIMPDGSYVSYLYGDGLVAQVTETVTDEGSVTVNDVSYYQYNLTGSTVGMSDVNGELTVTRSYDALGNLASQEGETDSPFAYVGKYGIMTDQNGLYYMRARYVNQDLGTFISADPSGQSNDWNLYRYANNNPTQYVDVTGEGITKIGVKAEHKATVKAVEKISKELMEESAEKGTKGEAENAAKQVGQNANKEKNIFEGSISNNDMDSSTLPIEEVGEILPKFENEQKNLITTLENASKGTNTVKWKAFTLSEVLIGNLVGITTLTTTVPLIKSIVEIAQEIGQEIVQEEVEEFKNESLPEKLVHIGTYLVPWPFDIYLDIALMLAKWSSGVLKDKYGIEINPVEMLMPTIAIPLILVELTPIIIDILNPENEYVSPSATADGNIDPSGYVYEAVESSRLSGVTATLYYKETLETPDEEAIVWDAASYDQENPLVTDMNGEYQWMVGTGYYKVVYEKDGYETAESDWLPVPPVQTDVNVSMVSYEAPQLVTAYATTNRVVLEFDRYLDIDTVNTDTVRLSLSDGTALEYDISGTNTSFTEDGLACATTFTASLWSALEIGETVSVEIDGAVSYAGTAAEYVQKDLMTEAVVKELELPDEITLTCGETQTVSFRVLDENGDPISGQKLEVSVLTESTIALADEDGIEVAADADGTASFTVSALKTGTGAIAVRAANGSFSEVIPVSTEQSEEVLETYSESLRIGREWFDELKETWTDGEKESDEIAAYYVDAFTEESDRIRAALTENMTEELALLDEWDQNVYDIIYGNINELISAEQLNEIGTIIYERGTLAWKYAS